MSVTGPAQRGLAPAAGRCGTGPPTLPAVLLAVLSALLASGVAFVALGTARGQDLDDRAMRIFSVNGDPSTVDPVVNLLRYASVGTAAVVLIVFMAMALLRRGFGFAFGAALVVAGANITTQVLKEWLLERPDLGHGTLNSLPSGHTTLVFSLALAAVLTAPSTLRAPVALGAAAVGTLTGAATVVAGWHRPSDVVVAMLVSLVWAAAVVAVLGWAARRPGRTGGRWPEAAALAGSAAAILVLMVWNVAPGPGPGELLAAVLAMGSIAVTSAVAVGLFARLAQRS